MNAATPRWRHVRLWGELFALSWREHPVQVALLLALKLASAGTIAAIALSLRLIVDGILAHDPRAAMIAAACAALSATVAGVAPGLESYLGTFLADSIGQRFVEPEIQREVVSLPGLEHLERTDVLDRLTALEGAFWNLPHGLWNAIEVVFAALRLIVLLLLLGTVSPVLLLLLVVAALALWLDQRGRRGVVRAETETAELYRLQRHLFTLARRSGWPAWAASSPDGSGKRGIRRSTAG
jgi:ATP-binding cassette, subfamily B, bacterial